MRSILFALLFVGAAFANQPPEVVVGPVTDVNGVYQCTVEITWRVQPKRANVHYASPTGAAANPGTLAQPWSLDQAKKAAQPGDVVNLMPGVYPATIFGDPGDAVGTAEQWITYRSYPEPGAAKFSSVTFRGGRSLCLKIAGLDVECLSGSTGVQVRGNASGVVIQDCKVHGQAGGVGPSYANILISSAADVLIDGCEVFYSGKTAHGVQLESSRNVVVRRCHVHDIISSGIRTNGGERYTVEYNRVHEQREDWNPEVHGSGLSIHSHGTTLRGNIVYDFGNTRCIRFYQAWAGPEGYHDMLVESNLVYQTPGYTRAMGWPEFIDLGANCVFRNNTFLPGCMMFFAQNADGTGLSLWNNIFAGGLTLSNYGTSTTLKTLTASQSRAKWDLVSEGNNLYNGLSAQGCGYLCRVAQFSPASTSRVMPASTFGVGSFFAASTGEHPYQLVPTSPAIGFADPANAAPLDLLGRARGLSPDAGCYQYGIAPL